MKRLILPLALLAMAALLGAAAAWDCVRLAADARRRVELADQEMQKHELRLIKRVSGPPQLSSEVQTAIEKYQGARDRAARHDAYDEFVASFRKSSTAKIDPTNPLDRKLMDDIAGADNRREIAQKQYDEELAAYRRFLQSARGRVARWFSSQSRRDAAGA